MWNRIKKYELIITVFVCIVFLLTGCRKTKTIEEIEKEQNEEWGSLSSFYNNKNEVCESYFVFKYKDKIGGKSVYLIHSHYMSTSPQLDAEGAVGEEKLIEELQRPCVLQIGGFLENYLATGTYDKHSELDEQDVELLITELKRKEIRDIIIYKLYNPDQYSYQKIYPEN